MASYKRLSVKKSKGHKRLHSHFSNKQLVFFWHIQRPKLVIEDRVGPGPLESSDEIHRNPGASSSLRPIEVVVSHKWTLTDRCPYTNLQAGIQEQGSNPQQQRKDTKGCGGSGTDILNQRDETENESFTRHTEVNGLNLSSPVFSICKLWVDIPSANFIPWLYKRRRRKKKNGEFSFGGISPISCKEQL